MVTVQWSVPEGCMCWWRAACDEEVDSRGGQMLPH
jgi:hypothetical protein